MKAKMNSCFIIHSKYSKFLTSLPLHGSRRGFRILADVLGTCQKLAGGEGGGNFKFGFRNEVTHPCNASEIC